jgi:hypothetical protein
MLTQQQKQQFSEILEELGISLDITKAEHDEAVRSYEFVGQWLSASESTLAAYNPEILPQGSFMLGTMVKPVHEDDELDIDLVCRLEGKRPEWTQYNLKQIVGQRLAGHGTLKHLLRIPDGRRCWTLQYSDSARFHLDILPSIVSSGYRILLERSFSNSPLNFETLSIRLTDKLETNYQSEVRPERWPKSNPFGYGIWFENRAQLLSNEIRLMSEAVQPVPKYQAKKLPLQRIVQILKRHRDMMFIGDDDKPISIIITTLAAKAYNKETNIFEALLNVIGQMTSLIEERYSEKYKRSIKWIGNPVNNEENFADKWPDNPKKQENFYKWIDQAKTDLYNATRQQGLHHIQEALTQPFGKEVVTKTFSTYAEKSRLLRENGSLKMAAGTGILGSVGTTVKGHNFHGE